MIDLNWIIVFAIQNIRKHKFKSRGMLNKHAPAFFYTTALNENINQSFKIKT